MPYYMVSQAAVVSLASLNRHLGGDSGMILSEICLYSIMKYCYFCRRWSRRVFSKSSMSRHPLEAYASSCLSSGVNQQVAHTSPHGEPME